MNCTNCVFLFFYQDMAQHLEEFRKLRLFFTKTQRGKAMLVHDGYKYVTNRESLKNIFWRCNRYVKFGCKAGAVTSKHEESALPIRLTHEHSHPKEDATLNYADVKEYEILAIEDTDHKSTITCTTIK